MKNFNWDAVEALFEQLSELPKKEQDRILAEVALTNAALAAEVQSLLEEDAQPHRLFEANTVPKWEVEADAGLVDSKIGAFTLKRWIGSGGMGSVFEAIRSDGEFDQQVAVKLMRPGVWSDERIAHFRGERQILAQLQHPNIARLYDGGVSESGRPYFTMELLQGMPITTFVAEKKLAVGQRIELFKQVCEAVRYAHQKLVVHLDLKPANILVDENGRVKLLDFGISKMLDQGQTPGSKAYTLMYAAPELIRGEGVSTATDVFALGLILYEVLTGLHPFAEKATSSTSALSLMEQFVPQAPSKDVRMNPPVEWRKKLLGDLDAIVLRAIQKHPGDRYASVDAMLADLEAWSNHYPVSARAQTTVYRLKKYFKRHQLAISLSGIFSMVLLGTGLAYTIELNRQKNIAVREAEKARQVKELTLGIFNLANPTQTQRSDITAVEILDISYHKLGQQLAKQPDLLPEMYITISDAYLNLGEYDKARSAANRALVMADSLYHRPDTRIAWALLQASVVYSREYADLAKADSLLGMSYAMLNRSTPKNPTLEAAALYELAVGAYDQQAYERADSLYRQAIVAFEALSGDFRSDIAECMHMRGTIFRLQERWKEAEYWLLEARRRFEELYIPPHDKLAWNLNHLAGLYLSMRKPEKAEPLAKESWEQRIKVFGRQNMETIASLGSLGHTYKMKKQYEKALAAFTEALEGIEAAVGESHPYVAAMMTNIGITHASLGHPKEAEALFRKAIDMQDKLLPQGQVHRAIPYFHFGKLLITENRLSEAEKMLRIALDIRLGRQPETHVDVASVHLYLGECLLLQGHKAEALSSLKVAFIASQRDTVMYKEEYEKTKSLMAQAEK